MVFVNHKCEAVSDICWERNHRKSRISWDSTPQSFIFQADVLATELLEPGWLKSRNMGVGEAIKLFISFSRAKLQLSNCAAQTCREVPDKITFPYKLNLMRTIRERSTAWLRLHLLMLFCHLGSYSSVARASTYRKWKVMNLSGAVPRFFCT